MQLIPELEVLVDEGADEPPPLAVLDDASRFVAAPPVSPPVAPVVPVVARRSAPLPQAPASVTTPHMPRRSQDLMQSSLGWATSSHALLRALIEHDSTMAQRPAG
jgi:hypothetical protein